MGVFHVFSVVKVVSNRAANHIFRKPCPTLVHLIDLVLRINPFEGNASFLYTLKSSENLSFPDIFTDYRNGTLVENGYC